MINKTFKQQAEELIEGYEILIKIKNEELTGRRLETKKIIKHKINSEIKATIKAYEGFVEFLEELEYAIVIGSGHGEDDVINKIKELKSCIKKLKEAIR